jgi:hypothetical protein
MNDSLSDVKLDHVPIDVWRIRRWCAAGNLFRVLERGIALTQALKGLSNYT